MSNAAIVQQALAIDKLGIDCPFGWPIPFVNFLIEHQAGDIAPRGGRPLDWRRDLANRTTDLLVRREVGLNPLSVAADRIAHAAMRCAALLADLGAAGLPVDRSGDSGVAVEVYPAASLRSWNLRNRGYKRAGNLVHLGDLVDQLRSEAPWLDLAEHEATCRTSDDAFDAVIAALTARAVTLGLTRSPAGSERTIAVREGWIAVPDAGSLAALPARPVETLP